MHRRPFSLRSFIPSRYGMDYMRLNLVLILQLFDESAGHFLIGSPALAGDEAKCFKGQLLESPLVASTFGRRSCQVMSLLASCWVVFFLLDTGQQLLCLFGSDGQ